MNGKESRSAEFFTVVSTVGQIFGAKQRNSAQHGRAELPSMRNGAQTGENARKNSFLNYKSTALNQLSYAGKNTAHINGRYRVKQVADRVVLVTPGAKMAQPGCVKAVLQSLSLTI